MKDFKYTVHLTEEERVHLIDCLRTALFEEQQSYSKRPSYLIKEYSDLIDYIESLKPNSND